MFVEEEHLVCERDLQCPDCEIWIDLWSEPTHELSGLLIFDDYQEILRNRSYELDARAIAYAWNTQRSIAYLEADLISSQMVQRANSLEYSRFIRLLNDKVWPAALSAESGSCLFLGEIGDAVKVALKSVLGAYKVAKRFLGLLCEGYRGIDAMPWLQDEAGGVPRFSCTIGMIPLPISEDGSIADALDLLSKTLNGTWDINDKEVTQLYRLASLASPTDLDIRRDNWRMSLLLTVDAFDELNASGDPEVKRDLRNPILSTVRVEKHSGVKTEETVAACLFYDERTTRWIQLGRSISGAPEQCQK